MNPTSSFSIPFHDFGGEGKSLHFAHANGFPPGCYQQLIQPLLKKHRVIASKFRPLWGGQVPEQIKTWRTLADDLIHFLDSQKQKNVIGIGHSMGGTISAIAAIKRPDLFDQLILMDPVIFPRSFLLPTKFLPNFLLNKIIPPAKISSKRRDQWASKEEVYQLWRGKRVFRKFSDQVLTDYVDHAIVPNEKDGVTLAYSKEWETQVYITAPYVFSDLKKIKIPITIIRGEKTNVIFPSMWERWKSVYPQHQLIDFKDAGHLVPLEYPKEVSEIILAAT